VDPRLERVRGHRKRPDRKNELSLGPECALLMTSNRSRRRLPRRSDHENVLRRTIGVSRHSRAHRRGGPLLWLGQLRGAVAGVVETGVDKVVFSTSGLFRDAVDGWVKVEDFIIERILATSSSLATSIHASQTMPQRWSTRTSFGRRWLPSGLRRRRSVHSDVHVRPALLPSFLRRHSFGCTEMFGAMHLGLYATPASSSGAATPPKLDMREARVEASRCTRVRDVHRSSRLPARGPTAGSEGPRPTTYEQEVT